MTSVSVSERNVWPVGAQPLLELEVVLDDAVVDDHHVPGIGVRVGVLLGRAAVGGPARVADADACPSSGRSRRTPSRIFDPAGGAPHVERRRRRDHGDAGRVVAAVLEPLEPVDDDAAASCPPT